MYAEAEIVSRFVFSRVLVGVRETLRYDTRQQFMPVGRQIGVSRLVPPFIARRL